MKDHEIAQLVNELTKTANKYKGCQCMRESIRRVVILMAEKENNKILEAYNSGYQDAILLYDNADT